MKFYNFGYSNDLENIGYYPQTNLLDSYNPTIENSHRHVQWDSLSDFNPTYGLELHEKAFQTDIIDRASLTFGLVVSEKLKVILESLSLPPHRFYPISVMQGERNYQYYWFHYVSNFWDYVDLSRTEIDIYNKFDFKIVDIIKVQSQNQIKQFKKNLKFENAIRFSKIYFNQFFPNYDIFELLDVQYATIVSEKLKLKFEEELISGYEIIEYDKIYVC